MMVPARRRSWSAAVELPHRSLDPRRHLLRIGRGGGGLALRTRCAPARPGARERIEWRAHAHARAPAAWPPRLGMEDGVEPGEAQGPDGRASLHGKPANPLLETEH